jgi:AraC-like DNA-binding protein/putative methionine-R-sulfoxide reductase with GAF domain
MEGSSQIRFEEHPPPMANHAALANFLAHITQAYGWQICVNDFVGFIPVDPALDQALRPYMAHINPYCLYIKSERCLFGRCLALKKKLAEKSIRMPGGFFGICHAGVGEYIYPITSDGDLIGVIDAGAFPAEPRTAEYLVARACRHSGLDPVRARQLYGASLLAERPDERLVATLLEFVAAYLGNTYRSLRLTHPGLKFGKKRYNSSADSILALLLDYLHRNFQEPLAVPEIARICHCSESYINHLFKKRLGVNVRMYLNKLRIERGKDDLVGSADSIAEIALRVGYNDPSYFSKLFTQLVGISPLEYRRRFS